MSYEAVAFTAKKPEGKVRYWIWLVMFLAFYVAYLDRANVSVLIADGNYTQALGIAGDKGSQGLLMTLFLFFYGLASFFIGPIIDRIGPRRVLGYNLILWAALMAVMAMVPSFYLHLACRALLGLTEAMAAPVCSKLIHTWFPVQERSKANGVWFIGLNFSLLTGIPMVAWLVATIGWSGSFLALAVMNLVPVLACFMLVYDKVASHPKLSQEEREYIEGSREAEAHAGTKAVTSFGFLSKGVFWLTAVVYSMNLATFWSLLSWLPTYLRTTHGFSWALTGSLSAVPYMVNVAALIVFTPMMDRYNARAPFTAIGCIILTSAIFLLTMVNDPIVAVCFIAASFGCITIANCSLFPILQNGTESNEVATAAGFLTGVAYVFSSAFPYVMGAMYKYTGSLTAGFYLLFSIEVVAIVAAGLMAKKKL